MHVVVTGASSGIGEGLVREYVRMGASVTMVARRLQNMEEIAHAVGGKTQIFARDLDQVEQVCDWIEPAEEAFGPIDILINNAGIQIVKRLEDTDFAKAEILMRVDLEAPMRLMHYLLPRMLKRKRGCVVNIASMAGIAPTPGMFFYNAAKAGLGAASESLRGELRGTGVQILTVYPGPVKTPMAEAAMETLGDSKLVSLLAEGTTDVLAKKIRRAIERKKARVIYPTFYTVARHFPGITRWVMDRFTPLPPKDSTTPSSSK